MTKAILTDLGNVVVFFDRQKVSKELSGQLVNQPPEAIDSTLNGPKGTRLLRKFELGAINEEEYATELEKRFGCKLPRKDFWQCHTALFEPNHEVINLYRLVKRKRPCLKIVAVTNTDPRRLRVMLNLSNINFDGVVSSCFEGVAKPASAIFMAAVSAAAVMPADCLFVDDVKEYCDAAFALGIAVHHYRGIVQLRQELTNRGLESEDR